MVTAKVKSNTDPFGTKYEGLVEGKEYPVQNISMGQSYTHVKLEGISYLVNSVCLKFYENGKEINIYSDKRFNPYI